MSTGRFSLTGILTRSEQGIFAQVFWIALFCLATAAGARVEIPVQPVPFTLQTLVVVLAGAFLGARNGALSQLLYLGIGALGAPVFSSGGFGIAKLIGPTGGYLLAFPIAAALVGYLIEQKRGYGWSLISMLVGFLAIYLSGIAHLYAFYVPDLDSALKSGLLVFTFWDIPKLLAAAAIYHEFAKRWPKLPRSA